jgi:hypothetical protein
VRTRLSSSRCCCICDKVLRAAFASSWGRAATGPVPGANGVSVAQPDPLAIAGSRPAHQRRPTAPEGTNDNNDPPLRQVRLATTASTPDHLSRCGDQKRPVHVDIKRAKTGKRRPVIRSSCPTSGVDLAQDPADPLLSLPPPCTVVGNMLDGIQQRVPHSRLSRQRPQQTAESSHDGYLSETPLKHYIQ